MTDLASWLQAFAAIVALGLSTWSVFEARGAARTTRENTRADAKAQDNLRARMMAATIVIELQVLSGDLERLAAYLHRLPKMIAQENQSGTYTGLNVQGDMGARAKIELPHMLDRNLDRLHWLGHPLGEAMLLLVSLVFSLNGLLSQMTTHLKDDQKRDISGWLEQINPHLNLTRNTLVQVQDKVTKLTDDDQAQPVNQPTTPWYRRPPQ